MSHRGLCARFVPMLCAALFWQGQAAMAQPLPDVCTSPRRPVTDNVDGYLVLLEEAPMHPMELSSDGSELWVANIPDATISVFDLANPAAPVLVEEIGVGLGPVTVRRRPPGPPMGGLGSLIASHRQSAPAIAEPAEPIEPAPEIWVVCQSSNAVLVIDEASRRVKASIRLTHEPSDLVFDGTGSFAYVSLSASNRIAKIDTGTLTQVATFEVGSNFPDPTSSFVHAEEPRSLLLAGHELFALSFLSGNGTTGTVITNPLTSPVLDVAITNLWDTYDPLGVPVPVPPPPDRDVFRFDLGISATVPNEIGWRFGTLDFDLLRDSDGNLWVSNLELQNQLVGEFQFADNDIALHRITIGTTTASPDPPTTPPASIDLNVDKSNLLPADYACATPTEMAFSADESYLFVACYESRSVAVVDVLQRLVVAELRADFFQDVGVGPRGVVLKANGPSSSVAYVYNRGDNTLQAFNVPNTLGAGTVIGPASTTSIGFDVTPEIVRAGRFHHIDAANAGGALAGTQSCNTCHVDGHFDGVAWNLSDFTAVSSATPLPALAKGAKVTMSLRGIANTPPFHWRGDRSDLAAFDPAFEGLLGGTRLSLLPSRSGATPSALEEFEAFIFALAYPANPKQSDDRRLSAPALDGFECFVETDAHDILFDKNGTVTPVTCEFCHNLRGFSGTNNQVNNDVDFLLADDATQLKGLFDKENDQVDYGSKWQGTPLAGNSLILQTVPATGWGFANTGFSDTLLDFVNLVVFNKQTVDEKDRILRFMAELDTGIPPAAAYAWTLNLATSGIANPPPLALLMPQARRNSIELVARGWMIVGGVPKSVKFLYDPTSCVPASPALCLFRADTAAVAPQTFAALTNMAAFNRAVLTFVGVPVGMGHRLGLDREMDFLLDGDEAAVGASTSLADTDGDSFPDGYEVRLGSNPANALSLPPAEFVPPAIGANAAVSWTNSSIAKVRWTTDEESKSRIEVFLQGATGTPLQVVEEGQFKKFHSMLVRGLDPGVGYDFRIEAEDPAGNVSSVARTRTLDQHDFQSVHVIQTKLKKFAVSVPGNKVLVEVKFTLRDESGAPLVGAKVRYATAEWVAGGAPLIGGPTTPTATSDPNGVLTTTFVTQLSIGQGATVEAVVLDVDDVNGGQLYFHPEDGQFGHRGTLSF